MKKIPDPASVEFIALEACDKALMLDYENNEVKIITSEQAEVGNRIKREMLLFRELKKLEDI